MLQRKTEEAAAATKRLKELLEAKKSSRETYGRKPWPMASYSLPLGFMCAHYLADYFYYLFWLPVFSGGANGSGMQVSFKKPLSGNEKTIPHLHFILCLKHSFYVSLGLNASY